MNFIVNLPKLKDLAIRNTFNSILIIINRLTKYFYIIPFKEMYIVKQLKYIVLNKLIKYYGFPKGILSNKD